MPRLKRQSYEQRLKNNKRAKTLGNYDSYDNERGGECSIPVVGRRGNGGRSLRGRGSGRRALRRRGVGQRGISCRPLRGRGSGRRVIRSRGVGRRDCNGSVNDIREEEMIHDSVNQHREFIHPDELGISSLVDYSDSMESCGRAFDREVADIQFHSCSSCKRSFPDLDIKGNSFCKQCQDESFRKKYSDVNNMDPGDVPEQLKNLTYIEQMLIAQVHPVVSLYRLRGAQYCYSGNVINFYQDISTYIEQLPIHPSRLSSTIIFNKNTAAGCAQFKASASKLREALVWLKRNNLYYQHINIDENCLNELPNAESDISHMFEDINEPEENQRRADRLEESYIPSLRPINRDEFIRQQIEVAYPGLAAQPINEYLDEGYIVKAFPSLFPCGKADLRAPRGIQVSEEDYFKHLMKYQDGRFAGDPRFRFFAMNTIMRHNASLKANMFVKRSGLESINMHDLQLRIRDDPTLINQVMVWCASLRSTKSYWRQRCSELLKMVEQIGMPTIFFTLSAADYHWNDLFRLLAPQRDVLELSERERARLMHENPLLVSFFFQRRAWIFIEKVLKPIFRVKDYWVRYEWQWRGSPHLHGMIWLDNAPFVDESIADEESLTRIKSYFDELCYALNPFTCSHPAPAVHPCRRRFTDIQKNRRLEDLGNCLNNFQRHTVCSTNCLRKKDGSNRLTCRYNFPQELRNQSSLSTVNNQLTFLPRRNDDKIARYHPFVTQVWRGNTDFTPITSKNGVLNYIAKYASKSEKCSSNYLDLLKSIAIKQQAETPGRRAIQKLLISTVGERDYPAQEVTHILMSWPLFRSSRDFVCLSLGNEQWDRIQRNRPDEQKNLIDKYRHRPTNEYMRNLSLQDFAKKIRTGGQRYHQRRTEAILRVFPILKLTGIVEEDEEFYKQRCILNIPFYGDQSWDDMLAQSNFHSWKELFINHNLEAGEDEEFPDVEYEGEVFEPINQLDQQDDYMVAAAFRNDNEGEILGERIIDAVEEWDTIETSYSLEQVNGFLKNYKRGFLQPIENIEQPQVAFSPDQQVVLDICTLQIRSIRQERAARNTPRTVAVQGKAGSGKSTVIKEIVRRVREEFGESSIKVCAPTGAAAVNVDGNTIHSYFKIYPNKAYEELNGDAATRYQQDRKDLKFIIIDEMSMIGANLLYKIEKRCREINPDVPENFGGVFVYFFGDFRQLPPVKDTCLYAVNATKQEALEGIAVFNSFDRFLQLTNSHRQRSANEDFRVLLDNLANGLTSEEHYNLLMSRRAAVLSPQEKSRFADAIKLLPTHDAVDQSNEEYLRSTNAPVASITSENTPDLALRGTDDQASGLAVTLKLAIGCRIMLRRNLWVERGLVNGTLGTLRKIVFAEDKRPPCLPAYVLVEFDGYAGPCIGDNLFPVIPVSNTWVASGIQCQRKQLPLCLAHAITIHKSQGLTLSKAAVDIGKSEPAVGLSYVALSRVRTLDDLLWITAYPKSRFDRLRDSRNFINRMVFLNRHWPQ